MMKPLGTVAEISTGYPFRRKVESESGGDLVVVQIKDIGGLEGVAGSASIMLRSDAGDYERYLLKHGDLLFQSRGSRHPATVVQSGLRGIAASGLHVIRPTADRFLPEFLAWWINHPQSQARFVGELARGSYIPFVAKADLERFAVPVPSLAVQRKIVEIEALRRQHEALINRLDSLWNDFTAAATWHAATRT